ncbi:MAG: hypothetical protein PHG13_00175 [Candidatus Pacebacteria bacterium]|nr:hypothetical protein [Candidatus Paceibacterota bacterium]MDD5721659.1 hypothetical protein [Candidatus Paceibacterota bacterium]
MKSKKKKILLIILIVVVIVICIDYVNWKKASRWQVIKLDVPYTARENYVRVSSSFDLGKISKGELIELTELRIASFKILYPKTEGEGIVHEAILREWFRRGYLKIYTSGFRAIPSFRCTAEFSKGGIIEIWVSNPVFSLYYGEILLALENTKGRLLTEKVEKIDFDYKDFKIKELTGP